MTYIHQRSERWWLIHNLLSQMPLKHALYWCESELCGCLGCANRSGGLNKHGITKEEWSAYMAEQLAPFQANPATESKKCICDVHPWCPIHGSQSKTGEDHG